MTPATQAIVVAIIGALSGIIVALSIIHKNAADVRLKEKETDNQAGQLALNLATQLKVQLDALELKGNSCAEEIEAMKILIGKKNNRIEELERKTREQDEKLADQDRKILILRKISQEKDTTIEELKVRLEAIEKSNGADCGEAE
jgi:chromosome segregation ATPase